MDKFDFFRNAERLSKIDSLIKENLLTGEDIVICTNTNKDAEKVKNDIVKATNRLIKLIPEGYGDKVIRNKFKR